MRTSRRKPPLHKRARQGTKREIRRYQFGGTAEEEYQRGLVLIKEGKFRDATMQFQKAVDQGHPSAAEWLKYAQKRSIIPKFIDATEIIQGIKSISNTTEREREELVRGTNFYLTYLINQGNSIRATHALLYNKIIEKAKPTLYPPTRSRFQQAQNMVGSLAFWRGGAVEQEIYDSTLPVDPKKVKQMAEFVIDAAQHSLVSSNQDMVLLISNIANWIQNGSVDTNLAKHIVTASKNLTEIHLLTEIQRKRQEGQDTKSARINAEAELTSYFMQMESNLVKTLQKWDEIDSYSKLVKNIMGQAAAGGKIVEKVIKGIKTKRFVGGDVRAEILASIPNTAQCNTGMIDSKKDKCYLCGFALDNYKPDHLHRHVTGKGKAKADCVDEKKSLCPPNAIDCEHVLGIQLALSHLNLVHTGDREYQKTTSNVYKEVINSEYDWSHKCCNMMKLDRSFIRKIVEGENTGFYEPDTNTITSVLDSISKQASLNFNGEGYAYGCGCIGAVDGSSLYLNYLVHNQVRNVVARVKKITDMINLQIMGIDTHLQKQNEFVGLQGTEIEQYRRASEVYDSFIKFRFLSRITKNNWIKALTNNFIHGSIAPGSAEEIEENDEIKGGAKYGVVDEPEKFETIDNFRNLVNYQSMYDMGSIQIMSDNTVVDTIRDIVKDTCDLDNADKKQKLKTLKSYLSAKRIFMIKTANGQKEYIPQISTTIQETNDWLRSAPEDSGLSPFLNETIPLELDKPIAIKQDQSTEAYTEYCKSQVTEMKEKEALKIIREKARAKAIENEESARMKEKAIIDLKNRIDNFIIDNIDHIALDIAGHLGEKLAIDGIYGSLIDALETDVGKRMISRIASGIINRFPLQDIYTVADIEYTIVKKIKEDEHHQYSKRYEQLRTFGSAVRSRMGNGGMTYDGARKRVIAQMGLADRTQYGAVSEFVKSIDADAEEITQEFIDTVKTYQLAASERQRYAEESLKTRMRKNEQDAENAKYRQPPIDPSRLSSLVVQPPSNNLRRKLPPPQPNSSTLQPPGKSYFQSFKDSLPSLPSLPSMPNFSSSSSEPYHRRPGSLETLAPSRDSVIRYVDKHDPNSNASVITLIPPRESSAPSPVVPTASSPVVPTASSPVVPTASSPVVPSASSPVVPSASSPVVPPGALPVYLQNRNSTYKPFIPRGHQVQHMPQSAINSRTAARAAHAPVLARERQQERANIRSGIITPPAGSTRFQMRATQPAIVQPQTVSFQPNDTRVRIVNAPPNNMNNTSPLWKYGGRHSYRRKTNKKRSTLRRSSKK